MTLDSITPTELACGVIYAVVAGIPLLIMAWGICFPRRRY